LVLRKNIGLPIFFGQDVAGLRHTVDAGVRRGTTRHGIEFLSKWSFVKRAD